MEAPGRSGGVGITSAEPGCIGKLHVGPDNTLRWVTPVEGRTSEGEGPAEELVDRVEPMLDQSREITQDLFELIGREEADLHEEITRTVETLQVFFSKWIVEIMYILRVRGVLRFNELKESLGGISGRTLSTRLTDLEERGLVHRELYDEMPVRVEYSLTEKGHDVANLAMPLVLYLRADEETREDGDGADGGG